ncbi:MAG: hypothetical protein D3924_20475, partial [Candidatus Electrothrix sp. AR4]|nr:hypothetical protein [Candidatus Electrothrix sp. AR4]
MEKIWEIALSIGGISAIGAFVFYSLYKSWISLPIFSKLTSDQTFEIMKIFLYLTFLALVLFLGAYVFTEKPGKITYDETVIRDILVSSADYQKIITDIARAEKDLKKIPAAKRKLRKNQVEKIAVLRKKLEQFKYNVFLMHERLTKKPINTKRLQLSKAYFDKGEFNKAYLILKMKEIDGEETIAQKDPAMAEKMTEFNQSTEKKNKNGSDLTQKKSLAEETAETSLPDTQEPRNTWPQPTTDEVEYAMTPGQDPDKDLDEGFDKRKIEENYLPENSSNLESTDTLSGLPDLTDEEYSNALNTLQHLSTEESPQY